MFTTFTNKVEKVLSKAVKRKTVYINNHTISSNFSHELKKRKENLYERSNSDVKDGSYEKFSCSLRIVFLDEFKNLKPSQVIDLATNFETKFDTVFPRK